MNDDELSPSDRLAIGKAFLNTPQGRRQFANIKGLCFMALSPFALLAAYLCRLVPGWHGRIYVPVICGIYILAAWLCWSRIAKKKFWQ
jgi:hypothetical protein